MKLEKDLELKINELAEYLVKKGVVGIHKGLDENEHKAIRFLKENELIKLSPNSRFQYISTPEINKINELGIVEYLKLINEKEDIELRKTKVDLELAEKMLKEFPKTKLFSRIGAFIGIGLAILEIVKWIMKLMSTSGKT
tara:strand:- start:696 stop:1115 length:420 start_codon:yes stop_codon:yes gene_type:complete